MFLFCLGLYLLIFKITRKRDMNPLSGLKYFGPMGIANGDAMLGQRSAHCPITKVCCTSQKIKYMVIKSTSLMGNTIALTMTFLMR